MKIAIVDDHKVTGQALQSSLAGFFPAADIRFFASGTAFIEAAKGVMAHHPDIILTDLSMPGLSGIELIEAYVQYKKKYALPDLKIIVLSSVGDPQTIRTIMRGGAQGYLSKEAGIEELATAIQKVKEGNNYIEQDLRSRMIDNMIAEDEINLVLSPREKELLAQICRGLTISEAADMLGLSVNTAKSYQKNIMRKFNVNRTADLILFAIKKGLYTVV